MTLEKQNEIWKQINNIWEFLSKEKKSELEEILAYWEKIKAEWEKKKKEFWKNHKMKDFLELLKYSRIHKEEIESKYEYLSDMKRIEREKYIEEYLRDDMIYSGKMEWLKLEGKEYRYEDWKRWWLKLRNNYQL